MRLCSLKFHVKYILPIKIISVIFYKIYEQEEIIGGRQMKLDS